MAKVVIVTPAPPRSRAGNRITALRWARILRHLGCRVAVQTAWNGSPCDLLVALHARKSHAALQEFRARYPDRPAVLALTGTDLYRDIRHDADAAESLRLATRLVILQEDGLRELDRQARAKTCVIHQSVETRLVWQPPSGLFRICVLGHLREEKDPFRTALALRHLPDGARIEVLQAGKPLSRAMERRASKLMHAEPRYRWLGELPHGQTMKLLARSHAMAITSLMEGGAHVVSEAIALGVPVLASDISGNRGLLGDGYPGYFPVGDEAALAGLIEHAVSNAAFLRRLRSAVTRRRRLVSPAREIRAWRQLLTELGYR